MRMLSDTQMVLLSTAATRHDGALLPPADGVAARGAALARSVGALVKRGLAIERTGVRAADRASGIFITDDGLRAINIDPENAAADNVAASDGADSSAGAAPGAASHVPDLPRGKLGQLVGLISAERGATLDEMVVETGWLPHTTRAALTRLRQRGYGILLEEIEGRKAYRCAPEA